MADRRLGPLWSCEIRIAVADAIILLDPPLEQCREWAMKRQREIPREGRSDVPDGCHLEGLDDRMMEVIERVDKEWLPRLRELAAQPDVKLRTIHFRERVELEEVIEAVRSLRHGREC